LLLVNNVYDVTDPVTLTSGLVLRCQTFRWTSCGYAVDCTAGRTADHE